MNMQFFAKEPKGLSFRINVNSEGQYPDAGVYADGKRNGTNYTPDAFIVGIEVSEY